jgi:hypothetical protein
MVKSWFAGAELMELRRFERETEFKINHRLNLKLKVGFNFHR